MCAEDRRIFSHNEPYLVDSRSSVRKRIDSCARNRFLCFAFPSVILTLIFVLIFVGLPPDHAYTNPGWSTKPVPHCWKLKSGWPRIANQWISQSLWTRRWWISIGTSVFSWLVVRDFWASCMWKSCWERASNGYISCRERKGGKTQRSDWAKRSRAM